MPLWLHRTDKTVLRSVASADLPEPIARYIEEPDLSAVAGQPVKYWVVTGDTISLASPAQQNAIDTVLLASRRDGLANEIDQSETFMRAFSVVVIDELNLLRAQPSLASLSPAQLKTPVRTKHLG